MKHCAKCGCASRQTEFVEADRIGYRDLDLRPPERERSTMYSWVQACPYCGYTVFDLSEDVDLPDGFLSSEAYTTCEGKAFSFDLASQFYRMYMIGREIQDPRMAFDSLQYAAWVCDDAGDLENAKACREMAIPFAPQVIDDYPEIKGHITLVTIDLLRRSGHFEELISSYKDFSFEDDLLQKVLDFQLQKAIEQDTYCYTAADVIGEG